MLSRRLLLLSAPAICASLPSAIQTLASIAKKNEVAQDFSKYCPKDIFTFYGFDHWVGKSPIDSQSIFQQQVFHMAPDQSMNAVDYYVYLKQQVSWLNIDSLIENMLRSGDMLRIEYHYQYGKATWHYLFKNEEKAFFYFNHIERHFSA